MKVTSTGIRNGYWDDRFGKFSSDRAADGKPVRSVPFSITDAPENTVSFAVVLDDPDAIPVCGFTWIHWTICNLTEGSCILCICRCSVQTTNLGTHIFRHGKPCGIIRRTINFKTGG